MIRLTATILRFEKMGEKTGWTYIEIPADVAQKLKPGNKKSFRVKGKLDNFKIEGVALLPMGGGTFILPLNTKFRKGIGKREGAMVTIQIEEDKNPLVLNPELMACLADEPNALGNFLKLTKSHQHYFSKWVGEAKTVTTIEKRIAMTVIAMHQNMNYSEMIRTHKRI